MYRNRRGLSVLLGFFLLAALAIGLIAPTVSGRVSSPTMPSTYPRAGASAGSPAARISVDAHATKDGVVFDLDGLAPQGAAEAILWYDTAAGHRGRRFPIVGDAPLRRSVEVSLVAEGLVTPLPFDGRLDYWWAVRGADGVLLRQAGSLMLPPELRKLAKAPVAPLTQWSEATSAHFRLRFYPGSEADRDSERLLKQAETALARAEAVIPATRPVSITTYLVPRVFWQGGVAYDASTLVISYADRNYAGVQISDYLTHEATHALANAFVSQEGDVGGLIGEGVAVYATGGHYGPEPIDAWAAVLHRSVRYVPLCRLRVTFPQQQHEIAYLEGASFVDYLIRTYGLPAFRDFYAHDPGVPDDAAKNVDAFCAGEARRPVAAIGKTYAELETGWLRYLDSLDPAPEEAARLWGQIRFFDLMRQYQERRDPAARLLPPPPRRWNDDLRRNFAGPATAETNTVQEALFAQADRALDAVKPAEANAVMDEIQTSLATNVITGTVGRQYADVAALLARYARAERLGDAREAAALLVHPETFQAGLWSDYRLELDDLLIEGDRASARVGRLAEPLDGLPQREALRVTLVRGPSGWRIDTLAPDPDRLPKPAPPRQNRVVARMAAPLWPASMVGPKKIDEESS
jgi:hypothetical protein